MSHMDGWMALRLAHDSLKASMLARMSAIWRVSAAVAPGTAALPRRGLPSSSFSPSTMWSSCILRCATRCTEAGQGRGQGGGGQCVCVGGGGTCQVL